MKVGIFYGSTTGITERISKKVASLLKADVFNACEIDKIDNYDFLIFATSTWGMGLLQNSWVKVIDSLKNKNLSNKKVALIGIGNQIAFNETFVNGMGILYDAVIEAGAEVVGKTSTEGYEYSNSIAVRHGYFVGLPIDEKNQKEMTEERIKNWIENIM